MKTIELDVKFEKPWELSTLQPDVLLIELCGRHFATELQKKLDSKTYHKGCLILEKEIPQQIYRAEAITLRVLNVIIALTTYLLVAELVEKTISTSRKDTTHCDSTRQINQPN